MAYRILAINPGSTSTKIGVFEDEKELYSETIRHSAEEIGQFAKISDQTGFRKQLIMDVLKKGGFEKETLAAVVGRGGLLKPITGGTYVTTPALLKDLEDGVQGQHASNLGGLIAYDIAQECGGIPSFIVDPVVVDELQELARISGHPKFPRTCVFHALNQKAIAKRYAKEQGKKYEDLNLVIAHLGGGISVGAHKKGLVVDVFNALDGDGSFAPERSGRIQVGALVKYCFSGEPKCEADVYKMLVGKGGVVAHLGTNDMREVEDRAAAGEKEYKLIWDAFIYGVAKDIGAMAVALEGKVDQILVTGGIAYSKYLVEEIRRQCGFIAGVTAYPGEDELLALAQGALRVLTGEEESKEY